MSLTWITAVHSAEFESDSKIDGTLCSWNQISLNLLKTNQAIPMGWHQLQGESCWPSLINTNRPVLGQHYDPLLELLGILPFSKTGSLLNDTIHIGVSQFLVHHYQCRIVTPCWNCLVLYHSLRLVLFLMTPFISAFLSSLFIITNAGLWPPAGIAWCSTIL